MGSPEDCSVACVDGGSVDGFTSCVVGMCSMKRAADVLEARQASIENETLIVEPVWQANVAEAHFLRAPG